LLIGVVGGADGIAEWKVGKGKPWDGDLIDDVSCGSNDDCRNSVVLEVSCGQTDRLVTDRSKGHQHREVDVVVVECLTNRLGPLGGSALTVDGWYSTKARGNRTNDTLASERVEVFERQERTEVVGVCGVFVPGEVFRGHRGRGRRGRCEVWLLWVIVVQQ